MRLILNRKSMFLIFFTITVLYLCFTIFEMTMLSTVDKHTKAKRMKNDRRLTTNITQTIHTDEYLAREAGPTNEFNQIPVNRNLPDTRSESCKERNYFLEEGLKASVIITFFNESRSALLRTITSILNRSPIDLLEEIIVIDDCSTIDIEPQFIRSYHEKIRLIRNAQREGLIRSRNIGAKLAGGHYLVFLDSHCEVNAGWLEPLIHKAEDYKGAIVTPVLDVIDWKRLQYRSGSLVSRLKGGFDWHLQYKWIGVADVELESHSFQTSLAYSTPSIPGGIFLIRRNWFVQLGGFDDNLRIYGGESLELSLKAWMCGGRIDVAVCSRVGHVFRRKHTFDFPNGMRDTILHNTKCIAESWLDDYKFFYYSSQPTVRMERDDCSGNIEKANRIKQKLQCRSFQWYLQNVFPELNIPNAQYLAFGELRNGKNCLQMNKERNVAVALECMNDASRWFFNQSGTLSLQNGNCLTFDGDELKLMHCESGAEQMWMRKRGNLIHLRTGKCLDNNQHNKSVALSLCHRGAPSQIWNFSVEVEEFTN